MYMYTLCCVVLKGKRKRVAVTPLHTHDPPPNRTATNEPVKHEVNIYLLL